MVTLRKILFAITICFTFSSGSILTTQASSWHKGTPKVIRGSWVYKGNTAHVHAKIGKNFYHFESFAPIHMNNVSYKKIGKYTYKIRGYEPLYAKKNIVNYFKVVSKKHLLSYDVKHLNRMDFYKD